MMWSKKFLFLICCTLVTFLTGCNKAVYDQTVGNTADVKLRTDAAFKKSDAAAQKVPSLVINQGMYVDKTPISLTRQPEWLQNRVVIRGDQLPFSYYSRTVASGGGKNVLTRYQTGLDDKAQVSMNYAGTVRGALDTLAAKTGYVYSVNGNNIYWQAFITKTFDIAFMPGSSDYMMGKASGGSSSGSSGSSSSTTTSTGIIDDSSGAQYSNLKGTLSIWGDLKDSITQMLSPDGKVMVSEATTTVTVRDRPTNVALISQFISNLNNNLSRQVLVKIQVLDVTLESDFNYGINWNMVEGSFGGGTYQLNANNGTPISITSVTGLVTGATTVAGINNPGMIAQPPTRGTGVIALINALKQQGKVSLVTEPRVLCQNNQVSAIRIIQQEGYLASVQTTSLAGSSSGAASVTSQLTPGSLVTGATIYVLPKIMGDKVYLQVNADLSTKQSITTIASNGFSGNLNNAPAGTSIIQVPNVIQKQFNQRSVIRSGDTLILSGFRQVGNQAGASQVFDSQSLGGQTAQQVSRETIVLITPIILHGTA